MSGYANSQQADLPPKKLVIDHDDYHAEHVGRTRDGRQFFLTTPFVPSWDENEGREFVAMYIFDVDGGLLESRIDDFGTRANLDHAARRALYEARLAELGEVEFARIEIAPFNVEHDGIQFGLIPRAPEEPGGSWWVELQPGHYMAFHEPWDSGEYDT